jgi:hypothetical protein
VLTKLVYLCPASGLDEVMSCASGGVRGGPPSALRHKQQKSSQQNCVVRESLTPNPDPRPVRRNPNCPCTNFQGRYRSNDTPVWTSEGAGDGIHLLLDRDTQYRIDGTHSQIEKTFTYDSAGGLDHATVIMREYQADGSIISENITQTSP